MVFRRRKPEETKTPALSARWQADIDAAASARRRYGSIVERVGAGPVRDRLADLTIDVDQVVAAITAAATRADRLAATLDDLDVDRVTADAKAARRALDQAEEDGRDATRERERAASLDRQLGSVHAVWDAVDSAARDLHNLQLQLEEAVGLAAVIASHTETVAIGEVGDLALRLRSLKSALDELAN